MMVMTDLNIIVILRKIYERIFKWYIALVVVMLVVVMNLSKIIIGRYRRFMRYRIIICC